jgi:cell division transport system permease protein
MKRKTSSSLSFNLTRSLQSWLAQHVQACLYSLGQMYKNPMSSLLTTAVIGVSLSLPSGFYLVLDNIQRITETWGGSVQVTLFLQQDVTEQAAHELTLKLSGLPGIAQVQLIERDKALEEYRVNSGFAEALDSLDENPLPHVLILKPDGPSISSGQGDALLQHLQSFAEVETAQFDRQWAGRLFALIDLFRRAVLILATLLAFAVLLIIGNTIRLAIYNRREEIAINQLFGATDAFIQRPFLYSGLMHGIAGSIMAWLLLVVSIKFLESPVIHLSSLYYSDFRLIQLEFRETMILIGSGGLLGLAGSWIAVQRHFKAIGLS